MYQPKFGDLEHGRKRKRTRREEFLNEMERGCVVGAPAGIDHEGLADGQERSAIVPSRNDPADP